MFENKAISFNQDGGIRADLTCEVSTLRGGRQYDGRMQPRDWFGVGVRLFGVWLLLSCVDELRTVSEILLHWFNPLHTPISSYLLHAVVDAAIGIYLLTGARFLMVCAFPRRDTEA
jgi:hypothetical protein